ncbi:unnamed protein product [Arabis nemorensis]|uniref:RRM domain-containing protein n=1 Tax=Arabis nemorensis TaxID=586526 RepID=A0A565CKF7_9BRAS|nr:unnamed protein product [Arabis nemorensis]
MGLVEARAKFKAQSFVLKYIFKVVCLSKTKQSSLVLLAMENSAIEGMKSMEMEDRDAASPKTSLLLSREKLAADRLSLISAMEKAAVEGFKPKDSEAAIRKIRICVEGYDTSLPYDDVKSALKSHLSSCGEILDICIPRYVEPDALNRYDAGKLTPEMSPKTFAIKNSYITFSGYWMCVSGYDTSLPDDDIKRVMIKHFSPCGPITQVHQLG